MSGNSTACNKIDMISGFVLFESTDLQVRLAPCLAPRVAPCIAPGRCASSHRPFLPSLQSIINFAISIQKLGDLNSMVYNATFSALSLANGQGDPTSRFYALSGVSNQTALGAKSTYGFNLLKTQNFRQNAYTFCTSGCLGVVAVNFFDDYNTAINGDFHQVRCGLAGTQCVWEESSCFLFVCQIVNGSCRDTFSLNSTAWKKLALNPPTLLTQDYYKCRYTQSSSVINAIGVGSGTAGALAPAAVAIFVVLIQFLGFKRAVLRSHLYSKKEMAKATEFWATHLLVLRDLEDKRRRQGEPQPPHTRDFVLMLEESDEYVMELEGDEEFYNHVAHKPVVPEFLRSGGGGSAGDRLEKGGGGPSAPPMPSSIEMATMK